MKINPNVALEPIEMAHANSMFRWMCNPEIAENIGLRQKPSLEKTRAWIEKACSDAATSAFAVMHDGAHVGNVVLDQVDAYLGSARFSIYIGEEAARGNGVAASASYLLMKFGFGERKLHKIWLTVHLTNYPAIHLYDKLGFRVEGVLRDEFWLNNRRTSVLRMGMLADDFDKLILDKS